MADVTSSTPFPLSDVCVVCFSGETVFGDAIVFCDGADCDCVVHQFCYGVPTIPDGEWLCDLCAFKRFIASDLPPHDAQLILPAAARHLLILHRESLAANMMTCALCPIRHGAFKPTSDGQWAHAACAVWLPETSFENPETVDVVTGIDTVDKARFRLTCGGCKIKGRFPCIQCNARHCRASFHSLCGWIMGVHFGYEEIPGRTDVVAKLAFCVKHHNEQRAQTAAVKQLIERGRKDVHSRDEMSDESSSSQPDSDDEELDDDLLMLSRLSRGVIITNEQRLMEHLDRDRRDDDRQYEREERQRRRDAGRTERQKADIKEMRKLQQQAQLDAELAIIQEQPIVDDDAIAMCSVHGDGSGGDDEFVGDAESDSSECERTKPRRNKRHRQRKAAALQKAEKRQKVKGTLNDEPMIAATSSTADVVTSSQSEVVSKNDTAVSTGLIKLLFSTLSVEAVSSQMDYLMSASERLDSDGFFLRALRSFCVKSSPVYFDAVVNEMAKRDIIATRLPAILKQTIASNNGAIALALVKTMTRLSQHNSAETVLVPHCNDLQLLLRRCRTLRNNALRGEVDSLLTHWMLNKWIAHYALSAPKRRRAPVEGDQHRASAANSTTTHRIWPDAERLIDLNAAPPGKKSAISAEERRQQVNALTTAARQYSLQRTTPLNSSTTIHPTDIDPKMPRTETGIRAAATNNAAAKTPSRPIPPNAYDFLATTAQSYRAMQTATGQRKAFKLDTARTHMQQIHSNTPLHESSLTQLSAHQQLSSAPAHPRQQTHLPTLSQEQIALAQLAILTTLMTSPR